VAGPASGIPLGIAGRFKVILLILVSLFVVGLLFYSQQVTDQLLKREREIVALYARSLEYLNQSPNTGDFSFIFDVIRTIDFPIVQTDAQNVPQYAKNVEIDTAGLSPQEKTRAWHEVLARMDEQNTPIRIALSDTLTLNYVHYGESLLLQQLRWLPVVELAVAALFVTIAYVGFSYIKRSEQSNIWVGMARETAHQLGTPLSSLMGWLERMRDHADASPSLAEMTGEMQSDIERLNKVAARFSKIGSKPDLKDENLVEVIEEVMGYFRRRLPRSGNTVELALETPGEFRASINRELFEWVVENLMKNALDAMEGESGKIAFTISRAAGRISIDVSDSGRGIDPKFHKEIFRPGYSTKKRGWGLGLSLSKRIIEDYHRGRLFVKQSAPGFGTTFRIRLRA
jgi:signal transduction histidine kinase